MNSRMLSNDEKTFQSTPSDFCTESYGITNPMIHGPISYQNHQFSHPLESSESAFHQNKLQQEMKVLRNVQGLHAPMRLAMELKATNSIGRHPFLPSSSLMKDVLLGRDEEIGFADILNTLDHTEQMGQPHAIVEKKMQLL
ncbi:hypothetical protein PV328_000763 [Microctonus aethiopoides]|uniref:Proteasome maturation protein n=1 Tax=Microctonus aethiopoides TaxID=144406 RepID=A0AA39FVK1_9HYME|nr:hypothetical protein PV328_000763 [Microctonus aethiopoides]